MHKPKFTIFSCRQLSLENHQLFFKNNLHIIDVDLLTYQYLADETIKNVLLHNINPLVFTSQHAVKAVVQIIEKYNLSPLSLDCFCITGITANFATENNFKVLATAPNSSLLAAEIIRLKIKRTMFCCGNIRLDDLKLILSEKNIIADELLVYNKILQPYKLQQAIDGILFFSPSQIDAFLLQNELKKTTTAFCIGNTTGNYLTSKTHANLQVAKHSNLNQVIEMTIEYFNT
jgi:uroporphyrinogen-III synthase